MPGAMRTAESLRHGGPQQRLKRRRWKMEGRQNRKLEENENGRIEERSMKRKGVRRLNLAVTCVSHSLG